MIAQFKCLWRQNVAIIIPRALFTVFRYCQPVLISRTIAYVGSDLPPLENRNEAFRLILATFVIYAGMAVRPGSYSLVLRVASGSLTFISRSAMECTISVSVVSQS